MSDTVPSGTVLCLVPGPTKLLREELAGVRWCFGCRKRLPHTDRLWVDEEPNYYEPVWTRRCDRCNRDRTQFPQGESW